mgnify:CR=1 FL=1
MSLCFSQAVTPEGYNLCHNVCMTNPFNLASRDFEPAYLALYRNGELVHRSEAALAGLHLPLVYNSSGYDSVETLRLLDGIVDIYMPDFKMWDEGHAEKYLHARDYPAVGRAALREMHRQVGELKLDENGLAKRGVLVRHLVMPNNIAGTASIAAFLARELSPHTYLNLMAQYHPAGQVSRTTPGEIGRGITPGEYAEALAAARLTGLHRFD